VNDVSVHTNKQIKSLLNGCVIYIKGKDNNEVSNYLNNNLKETQALFKTKYKSFIVASNNDLDTNLKEVFSYFYPRININTLNFSEGNRNQYLLELFGFKNEVRSGLLSIDAETIFTDLSNIKEEGLKVFLSQYVSKFYFEEFDDLPASLDSNISLDDETQELVYAVIEKFNVLKENGDFLTILPIIEKYIKENNSSNIDDLSSLYVDGNYNIYLPDYNNLEIKLSHLSKCIYLLFLNHSEGIHLKELVNYKDELIGYYKRISNRLDYDKMQVSIDDIVNPKSNAIYVHLSRIKSAFTKVIHPSIAKHYFIDGGKNKPKKIKLDRDLIQWNSTVEKTIVTPLNKEVTNSRNNSYNVDVFMGKDNEDSFFDD